jgi:hypothetical protein
MPPHKAYCLLDNGPQFDHVGVFNSEGKLVSVSAIPVTVMVSVTEPSDPVTQEWLTSTGVFAQVGVPRLAVWLVGRDFWLSFEPT